MLPARAFVVVLLPVVLAMEQVVGAGVRLMHATVLLLNLCAACFCFDEVTLGVGVLIVCSPRGQFIAPTVCILVRVCVIWNTRINSAHRYSV